MFSFFKKSVEQQAAKELKKVRKKIKKEKNGAVGVCLKFSQYILDNEPKISENVFIREKDSPYPKLMVQLSSIDLLNSWKKESTSSELRKDLSTENDQDGDAIFDLMLNSSKICYINSNLILNDTEIETLSQEAIRDEISPNKVREQMYEIIENPDYEVPNENPNTIVKRKLKLEIQGRIKDAEDGWENWLERKIDEIDPI